MPERDAVIIICSRVGSRRLPGKCFSKIEGLPAIEHILTRVKDSGLPIYLGVPEGEAGNFRHLLEGYDISMFEGDPSSPLHRTAQILEHMKAEGTLPAYIVRITHDDILIDSRTMLDLLDEVERQGAGYGCTPGIVEGAGVEVIASANILKAAEREEPTEFISYFVRGDGMPFPTVVKMSPRAGIRKQVRLTMDYPEDALVLKIVLRELGATASLDNICRYLDSRPYILNINRLPDVTFYTCAKDMDKWVADTMLSVLASKVPNMEYIVVDDGSKDKTLSEVAKFSNDPLLRLIVNEKNEGLASSSNIAVEEARGKLVVRVDADDMLISGAFVEQWGAVQKLVSDGHHIVYPAYDEINEYGGVENMAVDPRLNHHAGCAVMERAWLNEWKFREGLRHWDGLELFKRAKDSADPAYLDIPTWQYRKRKDSMSKPTPEREKLKMEIE